MLGSVNMREISTNNLLLSNFHEIINANSKNAKQDSSRTGLQIFHTGEQYLNVSPQQIKTVINTINKIFLNKHIDLEAYKESIDLLLAIVSSKDSESENLGETRAKLAKYTLENIINQELNHQEPNEYSSNRTSEYLDKLFTAIEHLKTYDLENLANKITNESQNLLDRFSNKIRKIQSQATEESRNYINKQIQKILISLKKI